MHCKDISLRKVDFPLTEESIYKHLKDWEAYRRTEYLILSNGDDLAVVRLVKDTGDGLFKRVTSCEIVSLPKDTVCA